MMQSGNNTVNNNKEKEAVKNQSIVCIYMCLCAIYLAVFTPTVTYSAFHQAQCQRHVLNIQEHLDTQKKNSSIRQKKSLWGQGIAYPCQLEMTAHPCKWEQHISWLYNLLCPSTFSCNSDFWPSCGYFCLALPALSF